MYDEIREISWKNCGKKITFYVPGKSKWHDFIGKYPVLSITGSKCELMCEHCKGKILHDMIKCDEPEMLYKKCMDLSKKGINGCLISGGSDIYGKLPWKKFANTIKRIVKETKMHISVHTGIIDYDDATLLADAGVKQALIDVVGDVRTMRNVFHLEMDVQKFEEVMKNILSVGIDLVPHVVLGIHFGKILGEYKAIDIIKKSKSKAIVFIVITPMKHTGMEKIIPPDVEEVIDVMQYARKLMPDAIHSLGCMRPCGRYREMLDVKAVDIGINRIAMPSESAVKRAKEYSLQIEYKTTCCSVGI